MPKVENFIFQGKNYATGNFFFFKREMTNPGAFLALFSLIALEKHANTLKSRPVKSREADLFFSQHIC